MKRCHYCSRPTKVQPWQLKDQGPLARLPHSPFKIKAGPMPLCVAIRQGQAAQRRAERSLTEHDEILSVPA